MTVMLYVVHVYERGRYSRTVEKPMNRVQAHRYAKTYNAQHVGRGDPMGDRVSVEAVVDAIPVQVCPPDRAPKR